MVKMVDGPTSHTPTIPEMRCNSAVNNPRTSCMLGGYKSSTPGVYPNNNTSKPMYNENGYGSNGGRGLKTQGSNRKGYSNVCVYVNLLSTHF